jgi:outer membrane lipoprotein-sorting protein
MSARRLVCLMSVAVLTIAAGGAPAFAQTWFDKLFSSDKPAPSAPASARGAEPRSGGMPANAMLPPKRPASLPAQAGTEAAQPPESATPSSQPVAARPSPVPPPPSVSAQPIVTAVAPSAAAAAPPAPLSQRQIVERANAYFNGVSALVGDFTQVGGDGRRLSGKLYLQRPGKIRFEYDAPATLEVIADGSSVAVRDRKLATQDIYSISQTPLKFLLSERIDLNRDVKIVDVAADAEGARIALEDKSTLGGTSKITLFFDPSVETLTRWRIVDPQGFQTSVALSNLDKTRRVDPRLFVINYERMLGESSR